MKKIDEEIKKVENNKKEDNIFYKVQIDENTYLSEIFKIINSFYLKQLIEL